MLTKMNGVTTIHPMQHTNVPKIHRLIKPTSDRRILKERSTGDIQSYISDNIDIPQKWGQHGGGGVQSVSL